MIAPIGVFDSGVGGLTVLAALRARLPREHFLYLGDTARLPYGTKSAQTVERYAVQSAALLVEHGVKALVVACNTASAVALPALRARFSPLPVIGVIEPGARAAIAATRNRRIAVIATEGTVRGHAYERALLALDSTVRVSELACQMFVALAEEGWLEGPVPQAIAARYLDALPDRDADVLVLGCTHFPLLAKSIAAAAGPSMTLVDSAATTAIATAETLREHHLLIAEAGDSERGRLQFWVTDGVERFVRVGTRFLGESLDERAVTLVDLAAAS